MRKCNIDLIKSLGFFNGVGFHLCFFYCLRLALSKPASILIKITATNSIPWHLDKQAPSFPCLKPLPACINLSYVIDVPWWSLPCGEQTAGNSSPPGSRCHQHHRHAKPGDLALQRATILRRRGQSRWPQPGYRYFSRTHRSVPPKSVERLEPKGWGPSVKWWKGAWPGTVCSTGGGSLF